MPARLCGSSASASGFIPVLSDGVLHLSRRCGRMVLFGQRRGGRQPLLVFEHYMRWDPRCTQGGGGSSASSSRAAPGFAMPTLRWGTKAPKDGWQDRGETPTSQGLGDRSQGSPRAKSFPHIPAEEKSPAAARVTNAGGIAPVQSLPRVSISSVGAAGPPGTSLTLKPSLAHMSHVSR